MKIKVGSLFDGIGGAPLSAVLSGAEPVWASEIEKVPASITKRHFPNMKHYGDITQINGAEIEPVDIIVGGSPCQDLSVAGKRAGLEGARSGLFMDQVRIVKEMRNATRRETSDRSNKLPRPRYMVWENVPGAFSSNKGEDFRAVLEEICKVCDPEVSIPRPPKGKWVQGSGTILGDGYSVAWRVVDAQYWGVPQRRRRIYLVADFGGHTAPEICFEQESVSRDITEGGESRKGITADAERSVGSSGELVLNDQGGSVMGVSYGVTGTLRAQEHGHQPIVVYGFEPGIAKREGNPSRFTENLCPTLRANMGDNQAAVAFAQNQRGEVRGLKDKSGALQAQPGMNQQTFVLQGSMIGRADHNGPQGSGVNEDVSFTLNTVDRHAVCYGIDQQGGKGGANYTENISPPILSDSHGTPHAVCYGISSYASNAMKSSNPHSGIYKASTARTIDQNGGNPACNQGGIAICFEPRSPDGVPRICGDVAPTLNTAQGGQRQPCIATGMAGNQISSTLDASFASKWGLDNQHVNAGCPNFINQPQGKDFINGQTKKTNTREILQLLQQEIGEKALSEWGFRVLASLQSQKILRQEMYGKVILQTRNGIKVLGHDALEGKAEEVARKMRDMSEIECQRCSPQGRKPSEQLAREFATYMSELSQQDSPKEKFVQGMWEAGQGTWILREALPEIQKIWESICVQKKSTHTIGSVRRLSAKECERLQGYPDGWTALDHEDKAVSDTQRYKALGNSFAVPNAFFVISRCVKQLQKEQVNEKD